MNTIFHFAMVVLLSAAGITPDLSPDRLFVGSTPCYDELKLKLGIPATEGCEFVKWKLTMGANNDWSAEINFGMSQPNTNGFVNNGSIKKVSGRYEFNQQTKVYSLTSNELKSPFYIKSMSAGVIHFSDSKGKLIAGNDGFGNALNLSSK